MTFRDCIFRDNDGGGGSASAIGAASSDIDLYDCEFRDCIGGLATVYQRTANLYLENCSFTDCDRGVDVDGGTGVNSHRLDVINCSFVRCQPTSGGGGAILFYNYGGGTTIRSCWFEANVGPLGGGAVAGGSSAEITDCVLWANVTQVLSAPGGALVVGPTILSGNTFFANSGTHPQIGGTIEFDTGVSTMFNNVIAGTLTGVAIELINGAAVTGGCNVFWDNPDGEALGYTLAPTDRIIDPQLCDIAAGDLTVAETSPCLPAQSNGCGQIGALGEGCTESAVEPRCWGSIKATYRE